MSAPLLVRLLTFWSPPLYGPVPGAPDVPRASPSPNASANVLFPPPITIPLTRSPARPVGARGVILYEYRIELAFGDEKDAAVAMARAAGFHDIRFACWI